MFWNIIRIYFSIFNIQNTESNSYSIFLNFFPIIFFWCKIYSLPCIFIYETFIFLACFPISSWFETTVLKNICHLFYWWDLLLLFPFLSNQENIYMIHHDSDLFYDIYSTINKHNQRQTHYLSLILKLMSIFNLIKKFFYSFSCFIINHDFYAITFWMYSILFVIIFGRNKVICR